jgi:hypothetical protein
MLMACGKKYSDYKNIWISKDRKVKKEPEGIAIIE